MKKLNKGLLLLAGAFSINQLNKFIFYKYSSKLPSKNREYYYNWHYGQIRYTVTGQRRPLLLIHGMYPGASLDEWEMAADILSKQYRVYSIDMLGFGNSQKKPLTYSSYMYSLLINDFIRHVIKKPTAVIASGESCGFTVISTIYEPGNIEKLILISPSINTKRNKFLASIIETPFIGTSLYNMITSRLNIKMNAKNEGFYKGKPPKEFVKSLHLSAHNGGVASKYTLSAQLSGYFTADILRALKSIDFPIHVIWGEENTVSPTKNIRKIKRVNKNIAFTIMEKTSFLPHIESPDTFVKICEDFLDK